MIPPAALASRRRYSPGDSLRRSIDREDVTNAQPYACLSHASAFLDRILSFTLSGTRRISSFTIAGPG
jgi:hypothetical protein